MATSSSSCCFSGATAGVSARDSLGKFVGGRSGAWNSLKPSYRFKPARSKSKSSFRAFTRYPNLEYLHSG